MRQEVQEGGQEGQCDHERAVRRLADGYGVSFAVSVGRGSGGIHRAC